MSCLGVHFALTDAQVDSVRAPYEQGDDDGVTAAVSAIEEMWEKAHLQETDKAWDAIHRCLSDGTLEWEGGEWPLKGAVLGGEALYFGDDYIVRFIDADEVNEVAPALAKVTEAWFRERFATLRARGYEGSADEDDFQYTWSWFQEMREFFARTAAEGRSILFTADQ